MKNLNFKYLAAKNFICFGPDGIELNLTDYGNVVLIRGYNLDRQRTEGDDIDDDSEKKTASNGTGKSSIPEILVYALFGRTIKTPKKINHKDVINNKVKKGLYAEVQWGDYRVIRTRKPDSLRIWESAEGNWCDETEITLGGIPATQKLVEQKLGLNYETFVNVVVFTDNNAGAFLELDGPSKREIVEDLLSLDRFRDYYDVAKKERNSIKNNIKIQIEGYQYLLQALEAAKDRVKQLRDKDGKWKIEKKAELKQIEQLIEKKMKELATSDMGIALAEYHKSQDQIEKLNQESTELIEKDAKVKQIVSKARDTLGADSDKHQGIALQICELNQEMTDAQACIKRNQALIASLQNLEDGAKCPTCYGKIHKDNYAEVVMKAQETMAACDQELRKITEERSRIMIEQNAIKTTIDKCRQTIKLGEEKSATLSRQLVACRQEITRLSKISKPDSSSHEQLIEQHINKLKEEAHAKRNEIDGSSPFVDLLTSAEEEVATKSRECDDKKKEVERLEEELPYYEFLVDAFGEDGLRRFVIDGILPALNSRIAYWLQFLIDSKIKLTFNNQFDEIIERNPADGDPFVYHAMSGGERRMLNLSVSQAFAHIMMLNSGASPSCAFLDEVTTNIDQIGVQGVYNMIIELAREKQVFVTTHDHDLLEMLNGCDTIELQKKDGFTRLI